MKKKLLATVGALALAAAMATSAFAAGFVGSAVGSNKPASGDVTAPDGSQVTIADVAPEVATQLQSYTSVSDMLYKASIDTSALHTAAKNDLANMNFLTAFDMQSSATGTFSFKINGIVKYQSYIILHQNSNGAWEVVGSGMAGDGGVITGTFSSFSPVVVAVGQVYSYTKPDAPAASSGTSTAAPSTSAVYAPQTGVNSLEYVAALGIAAGLAVLAFAYKKIKE